ncbi:MAG: amidohydrolase family protein [Bacteroidales bacterium]|nr:amidohydrolase family protein [Bacteroidales bacterium]
MSILLKNTTFIDWQSLAFTPCNIYVEEGLNGKVKLLPLGEIPDQTNLQQIDCSGKYVTKSFAIGHHHVYSALARGMPAPKKSPADFREILQYIWWNLDKCLDKEMIKYSALATAIASTKAGSTFVIDHHASPSFIKGSLETIAKAFEKVGVSHLLCYEITDRDGIKKADDGLAETDEYLQKKQGLVGLHASFTVGNETLKKAAVLMEKHHTGIHVHVAEDKYDQLHSHETYGKSVVERFSQAGLLESPASILVHGLHLSDSDRKIIADSPAWMVQNPESNLNNNVGFFNSAGLGNNIMLGTDGMHSDMLQSAKAAFFSGQQYDTIDYEGVYRRFRNVHHYLSKNQFQGDGSNNLVVIDYDTPTDFNADNFLGHFLFGIRAEHVKHVISNGKLILKDRIIQTVDESEILDYARSVSKKLWHCMQQG